MNLIKMAEFNPSNYQYIYLAVIIAKNILGRIFIMF